MSLELDAPISFDDPEAIARWTWEQLRKIEEVFNNGPKVLRVAVSHAEPEKTFDGMVVYADGSDWDPGSGEGFYSFFNSTWNYMN